MPESPENTVEQVGDAPDAESREIAATVEAILFTSDSPLPSAKIVTVAQLPGQRAVTEAVGILNARYEQAGAAFRIEKIAGGYQMLTLPEYHDVLGRLFQTRSESRLSQAALETLAIVAYRQPVIRADVEAIRGVACGEVLRGLVEKQLVKIVGRAEVLGRPMLYGTTRRFLAVFGLANLEDLPKVAELRRPAEAAPSPDPPTQEPSPDQQPPPAPSPPQPEAQERPAEAAANRAAAGLLLATAAGLATRTMLSSPNRPCSTPKAA